MTTAVWQVCRPFSCGWGMRRRALACENRPYPLQPKAVACVDGLRAAKFLTGLQKPRPRSRSASPRSCSHPAPAPHEFARKLKHNGIRTHVTHGPSGGQMGAPSWFPPNIAFLYYLIGGLPFFCGRGGGGTRGEGLDPVWTCFTKWDFSCGKGQDCQVRPVAPKICTWSRPRHTTPSLLGKIWPRLSKESLGQGNGVPK